MNDDKIYLLKTHLKTENDEYLYKIGRSKQQQLIRLTDYPKTYKIILTRACIDSINVEKKLIKIFTQKFKKEFKNEYFVGNENEMIIIINQIINDEFEKQTEISNEIIHNKNNDYKIVIEPILLDVIHDSHSQIMINKHNSEPNLKIYELTKEKKEKKNEIEEALERIAEIKNLSRLRSLKYYNNNKKDVSQRRKAIYQKKKYCEPQQPQNQYEESLEIAKNIDLVIK